MQIIGKMFHAHELEEWILLKCLYYSKQFTYSMQSLWKFQWHFFKEILKKQFKICMEPQKTPNNQNKFEKEEQSWGHHTSWSQTILQSYSNQDSMVLA